MDSKFILIFLACIGIILLFGKTFLWPVKKVAKFIGNSILGALLIFIINLVGVSFNFHIGLNIVTSIIVGILGIPGAVLLVILKIFCNL
ncbi:MAG: pro-sigmaK processing inhibitor BofA family protein [Clostridia bacterium]|nr:pro-sigmaK processing inhibitor BofA family protein [Clostridia bacterium]